MVSASGSIHQIYCLVLVKPFNLSWDHCHERPPVLKDHIFLAEGPTFQYKLAPGCTFL